jgi:predicted nucleotidyltransferase
VGVTSLCRGGFLVEQRQKSGIISRKVDSKNNSTALVKSQPPTVDELQSKLLPFCEKHAVQKLEVFGSVAERTARVGSDIDLMITLKPGSAESLHEFVGLQLELEDLLGSPVDLLERAAVESMKNPFKRCSILSCVKLLYAT